jgi:SAM-dependent methyltransferase
MTMPAAATVDTRLAALLDRELDIAYRRRVATVVEWLTPSSNVDSHVVDIGCGRGYFVHYYASLGQHRITGIEFDADIAARAGHAHAGRPGVLIVRGTGAALPLADGSCSGAILSEVIEHVADDVALLREAYRVLRPGGVAAITVPHARYPWAWDPINRTLAACGMPPVRRGPLAGIWAGHVRLYDIDGLRRAVRAAGFVIEAERAMVRHCLPFAHNLLYGIGKPLLESGLLPRGLAGEIDRHRVAGARRSHAARALHALLSFGDGRNRVDEGFAGASVGLAIKARKA